MFRIDNMEINTRCLPFLDKRSALGVGDGFSSKRCSQMQWQVGGLPAALNLPTDHAVFQLEIGSSNVSFDSTSIVPTIDQNKSKMPL